MCRLLIILSFVVITFNSCVESIDVATDNPPLVMVVEGHIGTGEGPYYIKISKTAKYGSVFVGQVTPVASAEVSIRSGNGSVFTLQETGQGIYSTEQDFIGEVGQSYSLLINTVDGKRYSSLPETIIAVPEISNIKTEFTEIPYVDDNNGISYKTGVNVSVEFTDDPTNENYYFWSYEGTYIINTRPDLYTTLTDRGPVSAPKDCCARCFVGEDKIGSFKLIKDKLFNGNSVQQDIGFIEDDGLRFQEKYHVKVTHRSITKEAYEFYEIIKQQLELSGDIFDPPPARITSNIFNIENPDEPVIGYFVASDVRTEGVYIERNTLDHVRQDIVIKDDCRTKKGSFVEMPDFWIP